MIYQPVTQVLPAEQAAGHDMPLGSALNLLDPEEQDTGLGLYLLHHREHGTLLLEVGMANPEYTLYSGVDRAHVYQQGTWEQVAGLVAECAVAMG